MEINYAFLKSSLRILTLIFCFQNKSERMKIELVFLKIKLADLQRKAPLIFNAFVWKNIYFILKNSKYKQSFSEPGFAMIYENHV